LSSARTTIEMPDNAGQPTLTFKNGRPVPKDVAEKFYEAFLRIKAGAVAIRMWERLFTEEDRKRLGGDLEECFSRLGTARMWAQAKGVSMERAVIDVARGVELMSDQTANWLMRELKLEEIDAGGNAAGTSEVPEWDAIRGELRFGGHVIRRIRLMNQPSNIQRILDAFEDSHWSVRIDSPLHRGQQQLHEALRFLNQGLKAIRFRSQEGGKAIVWERL